MSVFYKGSPRTHAHSSNSTIQICFNSVGFWNLDCLVFQWSIGVRLTDIQAMTWILVWCSGYLLNNLIVEGGRGNTFNKILSKLSKNFKKVNKWTNCEYIHSLRVFSDADIRIRATVILIPGQSKFKFFYQLVSKRCWSLISIHSQDMFKKQNF